MKISIDHGACQGHGQCQDVAPDLFELRDDGLAYVLVDEVTDPQAQARAQQARSRCPADAVVVE